MDTHESGFVLSIPKPKITIQIQSEPGQLWIFDNKTRPGQDSGAHQIQITESECYNSELFSPKLAWYTCSFFKV